MKTYTFHVSGTHCASCKILIEDILNEQNFIKKSKVDLSKETLEIETDSEDEPNVLASLLSDKIKSHGYTISTEKITISKENGVIWQATSPSLLTTKLFPSNTTSSFAPT